ncbi:MAG: flagellar biosynthesis protein FlgB [Ancrocorticia sp.]|nr:flagellar biosynthesis protein FlgB [Ancrocorticia sp.]MCI2178354.1 flagellar biosynthesis protein FlgB [Ancrocorticia sp.]MCI2193160.1 flagellar biosynthesis protein FlgB [Ancrocorticia sp.]MCI2198840.1 flagellar biosynthesis protein FlgB [Ancrocorticia sp.]
MFDSVAYRAMNTALDGLALRQRVIADNVANIQTPNFHAGRVQFEDALAEAVDSGSGEVPLRVAQSLEPTRTNGNNVNLDTETLLNIDTNLRYALATQAVDGEFTSIRTAIRMS